MQKYEKKLNVNNKNTIKSKVETTKTNEIVKCDQQKTSKID